MCGVPEAVVSGNEKMGDGQQVLCKFMGMVGGVFIFTENQPCVSLFEDPLHELGAKATHSVAMGHHNFCDLAAIDGVQKGCKLGPFPVKSGADVMVRSSVRLVAFQFIHMSLEIGFLVRRRYPFIPRAITMGRIRGS